MSNNPHSFQSQIESLREHYSKRVEKFGDSAEATQWPDTQAQERRLEYLVQIGELSTARILDFGCGTGHLLTFLRKRGYHGEYTGIDICPSMIETAREKFPEVRFELRDVLSDPLTEKFDYVFISGVFNNKVDDNWNLMTDILKILFQNVEKGLSFNGLSRFVDFADEDYFYADPMAVFQFCKENLSPQVTLKHDYLSKPNTVPFEYTMFVYASNFTPRKLLTT